MRTVLYTCKVITIVSFFLVLLAACKPIQVPENWAFTQSKYNYEKQLKRVAESKISDEEKAVLSKSAALIVNSEAEVIQEWENVTLKRRFAYSNDSIRAEYFIFEPTIINRNALFFLGNGSSIFNFATNLFQLAAQTNSRIYVINYRGYGNTNGVPSFKTQFFDNQHFIDSIVKKQSRIDYIVGYSLGSVFATHAAYDNQIDELYLLAPFSNATEIIGHLKKQYTRGLKVIVRPFIRLTAEDYLTRISNTEKITKYLGRLTIFHGTKDDQLPYFMGKHLYEISHSQRKELITIRNGGHGAIFKTENWSQLIDRIK